MRLNKNQMQFVINCIVEDIVAYLQEDYGYSLIDAFDKIYNSQIYRKLRDRETGLYLRSSDYVYDYLKEELNL